MDTPHSARRHTAYPCSTYYIQLSEHMTLDPSPQLPPSPKLTTQPKHPTTPTMPLLPLAFISTILSIKLLSLAIIAVWVFGARY
jgi:hypothetical protein